MIKEDAEDLDKEIIDLIVELKENQTQLVLMKKSFSRTTNLNALKCTGFRVHRTSARQYNLVTQEIKKEIEKNKLF